MLWAIIDITALLCSFLFGRSLISIRNQIQMAPARLNTQFLHSVHPTHRFKLEDEGCCVGANRSDVQEPFEFGF